MEDAVRRLRHVLPEIRDMPKPQLARQQEALAPQREHFAVLQRQVEQWQPPTPSGSPCTSMRSWPPRQEAVRTVMLFLARRASQAERSPRAMRAAVAIAAIR